MKRIAIVEDHEDMQMLYRGIFRRCHEIEIVLQADTAEDALERIAAAKPDLVIVDISLPGMDGITLTRHLRSEYPDVKIIIATGHVRDAYSREAIDAGADDYVEKGSGPEIVIKTCKLLGVSNSM